MCRRGILGAIGLILLLALLVGACAPQQTGQVAPKGETPGQQAATPQRGGTLRLGWETEPGGLDPQTTGGGAARRYEALIFNTLVETDENGKVVPELAESWSNPDPKTYVFKLRKDVKFHDGAPFNAAVVKFNIDRALGPQGRPTWRSNLENAGLASVDIVDDYTVRFNLKGPGPALPAALTINGSGAMSSPDAVKKWGDTYLQHPVGTGPFEFVEWVKGDHVTLKRFDGYWRKDDKGNPLPYVDELIIKPIPDATVKAAGLRSGTFDMIDTIQPSDVATIKADENLKVVPWGNLRLDLLPNCNEPLFRNKALRQALAWAIDREAIQQAIYLGIGSVAQAPLDAKHWAFDPQGSFYKRDLAKAKAKLAEGGKPNGFSFKAAMYNLPLELRVAQAVKGQLAEAGIEMEVVPVEQVAHIASVSSGKFGDAAFYRGNGIPEDPGIELTRIFHSKGDYNGAKCFTPEMDSLLEQGQQELDQAKRKAIYSKVQALALDESLRILIHHDPIISAMNKKVMGFSPNIDPFHLELDWIWVQK